MKTRNLTLIALITGSAFLFSGCKNKPADNTAETDEGIKTEFFGLMPDGDSTFLYTLTSDEGITVKITNYGGIVTEIITPDAEGNPGNVALGFDNLEQYLAGHPNFGALIGRFGNRIADAKFELNGQTYLLAANNGDNTLHGGIMGFDDVVWEPKIVETENGEGLQLKYYSVDLEEGYPGNLDVTVLYELVGKDLEITYWATTDKATPVNLTNHSYFNLAGKGTILDHILELKASHYTPVDDELIPTGEIAPVEGTPFDFTEPKPIGRDIEQTDGGYDHNFVIDREGDGLEWIGILKDPKTGRTMEVLTMEPGVQFYTGNFLDGTLSSGDFTYVKNAGLCLETQHYPDSPNQPDFPSTILEPGEKYHTKTVYRFDVEEGTE
ncbi:MAG: galactose mutarotase [Bacteroidales bacterium]|nr:galactose mutarotase [Bacteroidales bacterium]